MQDFKEKKRTVRKAVVLLAAFLALLLALSAFFKSMALNYPEFVQSRNRPWVNIQSERNDSIDVLVLGDSESYTTFSPMEIWQQDGISSFVCGQTGQEIEETYYMLKTALRTQKPKIVVFETNSIFQPQSVSEGIQKMIAQTANYYFPVFLLHSMWQYIIRDLLSVIQWNLTLAETTWKRPTGKRRCLRLSDFIWTGSSGCAKNRDAL